MKRILFISILSILAIPLLVAQGRNNNYATEWARVDSLVKLGLSRTAESLTLELYQKAQIERNTSQLIKSFLYSWKQRKDFTNAPLESFIEDLEQIIPTTQATDAQAIQFAILGDLYVTYFERNARRNIPIGETQKLNRLQKLSPKAIYLHARNAFLESLALSKDLDAFLSTYQELLEPSYSPFVQQTLYDFLSNSAIEFFSQKRWETLHASTDEDAFRPLNYLISNSEFVAVALPESNHPYIDLLKIYQEKLILYQQQEKEIQFVLTELERLRFLHQHLKTLESNTRYQELLFALYQAHREKPIATEIIFELANYSRQEEHDFAQAIQQCALPEIATYFYTQGAYNCQLISENIKTKELSLSLESAVLPNEPFIASVQFRNADSLYIHIAPVRPDANLVYQNSSHEQKVALVKKWLLSGKNEVLLDSLGTDQTATMTRSKEESIVLTHHTDFEKHTLLIPIKPLTLGNYVMLVSSSPSYEETHQAFSFQFFDVTNIGYAIRKRYGKLDVYALNRKTGKPLKDAKARIFFKDHFRMNTILGGGREYTFDKNGYARIATDWDSDFTLHLLQDNDNIYLERFYSLWRPYRTEYRWQNETLLFTDRTIYRPGQTIHFKGILGRNKKASWEIKPREYVTLQLIDPNHNVVQKQTLTSNEFGSFSGSFQIPKYAKTGYWSISDKVGNVQFSIEAYKRPQFEVFINPFEGSFAFGDTLHCTGKVKMFAGISVTDAKATLQIRVNHELVETVILPIRLDGSFQHSYKTSEPLDPYASEMKVSFSVSVTSSSGETQEQTASVFVGHRERFISLEVPETVNKKDSFEIGLDSKNSAQQPLAFTGNLTISKLISPKEYLLPHAFPNRNILGDLAEWQVQFSHYSFENELAFEKLLEEEILLKKEITSDGTTNLSITEVHSWEEGIYRIEFRTSDSNQQTQYLKKHFVLFDAERNAPPYPTTHFFTLLNKTVFPGEKAQILVGSSFEEVHLLMEFEHEQDITSRKWYSLSKGQTIIEVPILEDHRGNVAVHFLFMKENRLFTHSETIVVPYKPSELQITTETLRTEMIPNNTETWRFTIRNPDGSPPNAEVLASMFDASLDAFLPNIWLLPQHSPMYIRFAWKDITPSTVRDAFNTINTLSLPDDFIRRFTYPSLNWFGLDILRKRMRRISSPPSYVEGGARFFGKVVDRKTGEPLPGAQIILEKTGLGAAADVNGNFSIYGIPPGSYDITAKFIGYSDLTQVALHFSPYESKSANFALETGSIILDELVVEHSPPLISRDPFAPKIEGFQESRISAPSGPSPPIAMIQAGVVSDPLDLDEVRRKLQNFPTNNLRTNFQETAFFYPHLKTDSVGNVVVSFTVPQSLTLWKFRALAHTQDLKLGFFEALIPTKKPFKILANPPRFLRKKDSFTLTAKLFNQTDSLLTGYAQLALFDAKTMQPIDISFANTESLKTVTVNPMQDISLAWNLEIPDSIDAIVYRVTASSGTYSDGEERIVPIVSNKLLVTESLPLWTNGTEKKTFTFNHLNTNTSATLQHHQLKLEVTTNPLWDVVTALPYLIEFPYECAEQTFARYFANQIALTLLENNPDWASLGNKQASGEENLLLSKLEQNPELASVLLEETPWLGTAKSERERLQSIFDEEKLHVTAQSAFDRLIALQNREGGWSWFSGMSSNRFITQHIMIGMGYLQQYQRLSSRAKRMVAKAIRYLDREILEDYRDLFQEPSFVSTNKHITPLQAQYLFARSFFDVDFEGRIYQDAHEYFFFQAETFWLELPRQVQAMIALTLLRKSKPESAKKLIDMFIEQAMENEELGMFWKENNSYRWYEAPIETQALILNAFLEINPRHEAIPAIQRNLLRNKQVNHWESTIATTFALTSLLQSNNNKLSHHAVTVQLGDETIQTPPKEDNIFGTISKTWNPKEFDRNFANLSIQGSQIFQRGEHYIGNTLKI